MPSIGLEQLLALNPAWLLVAHYREEASSCATAAVADVNGCANAKTASVDSNAWARMRGICAAERIASDTVKIFHHQPLSDVK
jgi:iron complex transport system substrate-binding protein